MIPADLHVLFPQGIYFLLFLFPIVWIGWKLFLFRNDSLQKLGSREALKAILIPRSRFNYWGKLTALSLLWILAVMALMQPVGQGHYPIEKQRENKGKIHDIILLVDASGSMQVRDTRTGGSRLDYAKEVGDEIISRLNGENVALYAFTSENTQLSPRTLDYLFARVMLQQIKINEGDSFGTDFKKVLEQIWKQHFSVHSERKRTLIMISDGENEGARFSGISVPLNEKDRIFTVGVGSEEGRRVPGTEHVSKLDENWLREFAQKGGGKYFNGNRMTAEGIANEIAGIDLNQKIEKGGKEDLVYERYFQYPLALVLLLTGFILFFPDTQVRKGYFLLLLIPLQLHGQVDREAEGYYEAGIYDEAIALYQQLENKPLSDWQKSRARFNLATAYMMKQDWEKGVQILESISAPSPWLKGKIEERLKLARQKLTETPKQDSSWREPSNQLSEKEKRMQNVLQQLQQMEQQDRMSEKIELKGKGRW